MVKRPPMFPFMYDQKLDQSDTRQSIDSARLKTLFVKKLTVSHKEITSIAYWDGKGGITLGITTSDQMCHWDLVVANPLDAKHQMMDEEEGLWFKNNCSKEDSNAIDHFKHMFELLPVIPLTTKQNTPEWFLMRMFSCTSSTSDNFLAEVKKHCSGSQNSALIKLLDAVHGVGR